MSDAVHEKPEELLVRLPAETMFAVFTGVVLVIAAFWVILALGEWQPWTVARAGMLGALASVVVGGGGLLVLKPWNRRSTGDLALLWLGSTVVRVLLTPLLALVIYFAVHPPMYPFVLGAGTAYLVILLSETALVVRHLRRQFDEVETP